WALAAAARLLGFFALADVILGGLRRLAGRRSERIEILLGHHCNPAVVAHLDDVEPRRSILVHPVLAGELFGDALDRAAHAEWLPAADAAERLLLLHHARRRDGGTEIDLRLQRDDLLRAGRSAQPALHAGILREPQHRPLGIIGQGARWAGRDTGKTERAAFGV